jgi:hypothetical protein
MPAIGAAVVADGDGVGAGSCRLVRLLRDISRCTYRILSCGQHDEDAGETLRWGNNCPDLRRRHGELVPVNLDAAAAMAGIDNAPSSSSRMRNIAMNTRKQYNDDREPSMQHEILLC